MNIKSLVKPVFLIASTMLLGSGCVVREEVRYRNPPPTVVFRPGAEVVVAQPMPDPIVETVVAPPDPALVWIPGAWFWEGRWVWHPGRYDRPPRRGAIWVGPRYEYRGGRHIWITGGWR